MVSASPLLVSLPPASAPDAAPEHMCPPRWTVEAAAGGECERLRWELLLLPMEAGVSMWGRGLPWGARPLCATQ